MYPLDENWAFAVSVLAHRVARRVAAVVGDVAGLNLSQWRVLAALADRPGMTATEVVSLTPMDKGLVSRAVKKLVEAGLVCREASGEDARQTHLSMTDEGLALYRRLVDALRDAGATGEALPGGQDLNAALRAMIEAYEAASGQEPPVR